MQQLGECIGKGGFGSVYKALDIETGEYLAVKRISLKNVPREEIEAIKVTADDATPSSHQPRLGLMMSVSVHRRRSIF